MCLVSAAVMWGTCTNTWSRPRMSSGLRVGVVNSKQSGRVALQVRWNIPQNGLRDRMNLLLALLLTVMSGAALAQTTGTANPSSAPAAPSVKEDVPPGGCMPIGLTASGEIVFPIQCKEFIERQRGNAVEQKPAAVEEKAAAKQSEGVAPENSKPAIKPVESVTLPKRVEDAPRERAKSPDDRYCSEHYRSYDPASRTYTGYDGQRRPCR
jgi:BA14K-like protein